MAKKPLNLGIKQTPSGDMNNHTLHDYMTRLKGLALAMFKWEGLPPSVSARHLESVLYEEGRALFFMDPMIGFMALACTPSGQLNHYNEPIRYQAIGTTYREEYKAEDAVLIRNNYETHPTSHTINLFAQRLTNIERTNDVNLNAQKTPIIILCDESQRLTLKNLYNEYAGNTPFIFADKMMNLDNIKSINTNAPYIGDKLMIQKHEVWNDAMTFLGQRNANTDKKERMITDEVQANNQQIELSAEVMLLTRQEACDQINDRWPGLNVRVMLRNSPDQDPDQDLDPDQEEGEENG